MPNRPGNPKMYYSLSPEEIVAFLAKDARTTYPRYFNEDYIQELAQRLADFAQNILNTSDNVCEDPTHQFNYST